jgi:hypothetical protein|eukprot:m.126745 g.126745  ORF g.126745 m.126745 type:complete len:68 (-) comp22198_c0_seq1:71-274(-)
MYECGWDSGSDRSLVNCGVQIQNDTEKIERLLSKLLVDGDELIAAAPSMIRTSPRTPKSLVGAAIAS